MERGAWWATVHGVAKSRTRLSDFTFTIGQLYIQKTGRKKKVIIIIIFKVNNLTPQLKKKNVTITIGAPLIPPSPPLTPRG